MDQLHQVTEAAPILLGMPACRKRDQVCFGTDTASRTPFEIPCYRWNSQGGRNGQIQLQKHYRNLSHFRNPSWRLSPVSIPHFHKLLGGAHSRGATDCKYLYSQVLGLRLNTRNSQVSLPRSITRILQTAPTQSIKWPTKPHCPSFSGSRNTRKRLAPSTDVCVTAARISQYVGICIRLSRKPGDGARMPLSLLIWGAT